MSGPRDVEAAREWCEQNVAHAVEVKGSYTPPPAHYTDCRTANCAWPYRVSSLADLLTAARSEERQALEQIVREVLKRVLFDPDEEIRSQFDEGGTWACDEILRRLKERAE